MKASLSVLLVVLLFACGTEEGYKPATDAQDAGREFIRASLDGDMKKASFYLLRDSANDFIFNKWRESYNKLNADEKKQYRDAQIRPIRIEKENDTIVNYIYTNSYKQTDTTTMRVIKVNNEWLVDMKSIQ